MFNNLQVAPTGPQLFVNPFAAYRNYAMANIPFYYYGLPALEPPTILNLPLNDHLGIFTGNVMKRLVFDLQAKKIPEHIFAARVLNMSQEALSELINHPEPWRNLETGHDVYETIVDWIMLCDKDQLAVVESRGKTCCRFKTLKQRRELEKVPESPKLLYPVKLVVKGAPIVRNQIYQLKQDQKLVKLPKIQNQDQKPMKLKAPAPAARIQNPEAPDSILNLQLIEGSKILTDNLAERMQYELTTRNITRSTFAQKILNRSTCSFKQYLSKPKPWDKLRGTQTHYLKMLEWIQMTEEEKTEALYGSQTSSDAQKEYMDKVFKNCNNPNPRMIQEMAKKLDLDVHTIRYHFARMRVKASQKN